MRPEYNIAAGPRKGYLRCDLTLALAGGCASFTFL